MLSRGEDKVMDRKSRLTNDGALWRSSLLSP
jgi:hypothetical protein